MNRSLSVLTIMIIVSTLSGCALTTTEIARRSKSTRTDVFSEAPWEGPAPAGFVDLVVKATVKIPPQPGATAEQTSSLPFLVNIDGQAVQWAAAGHQENTPRYTAAGYESRDPEAGLGIRYRLEKTIRLASGTHRVIFGLPREGFLSAFKITLPERKSQVLEFLPLYRSDDQYKRGPVRLPSFARGIAGYQARLNGAGVAPVIANYGTYGLKMLLPAI